MNMMEGSEEAEDSDGTDDEQHGSGEEEAEEEDGPPLRDDDDDDDDDGDAALIKEAIDGAPANSSGYTLRKRLNAARKKQATMDKNKSKNEKKPTTKAFALKRIREEEKKKAGKKADDDDEAHLVPTSHHDSTLISTLILLCMSLYTAAPNQAPPKKQPNKSQKKAEKNEANCIPFALCVVAAYYTLIPAPPASTRVCPRRRRSWISTWSPKRRPRQRRLCIVCSSFLRYDHPTHQLQPGYAQEAAGERRGGARQSAHGEGELCITL